MLMSLTMCSTGPERGPALPGHHPSRHHDISRQSPHTALQVVNNMRGAGGRNPASHLKNNDDYDLTSSSCKSRYGCNEF